jgi:Lrp/AsnC family transcriptional regulator, leucine-responsive regulatory protein
MERGHIRQLPKFKDLIADMPQILECYAVTGDFDYVLKVIARDLRSLSQFLMDTLMQMPGVTGVRSSVCLDEIKCTGA